MTGRTIHWTEAEKRGLKSMRVLDARVAPHRDGTVFFIEELVEYDSGDRGWRRKMGDGLAGQPYTVKFDADDKATEAVATARIEIMAELAIGMIGTTGARPALRRLAGTGLFASAEEVAAAYHNMDAVVAEAMAALGEEAPARSDELGSAYLSGSLTADALIEAWKRLTKVREDQKRSREMQTRKAEERAERRERDYEFIVEKAMEASLAANQRPPAREAMSLGSDCHSSEPENVLDSIHRTLSARPYLRHVLTNFGEFLRLWTSRDGLIWQEWGSYEKWDRKRQVASRARATDAFGESPFEHWGKVRGRLLERLKSPELDLLHREDVIARLAEARSRGIDFVVIGIVGFIWDAEAGEWQRRDVERPDTVGGREQVSTLWREGRIVSNNHGRIIVLPFIKQDGSKVEGHTRNAPFLGPAEPRAVPVEIPFAVYDDLGRDETWEPSGSIHVEVGRP